MISARSLALRRGDRLLVAFALAGALAIGAIAAVVLWATLRPGSGELTGIITYTTAQGDASVHPDGSPATFQGLPSAPVVTRGGVEQFPAADGAAAAIVEREGTDAWLVMTQSGESERLAQLADETSPPLVNGVKGDAQVAGGVPLVVAWSPDSRYLAFGSLTGAPYALHVVEREVISVGRHVSSYQIASHEMYSVAGGYIGELAWSPSGHRLAISTYSADRRDHTVFVLDPSGGAPAQLIDGCHIIWSPDGEHIAIHRDPHREPGAWVIAVDGSEAYAITNEPTAFPLAWRPE
jgi:Tol biopolymer transport system component